MNNITTIRQLIEHFKKNYKTFKSHYNEDSCRLEFIDAFFKCLGWDVSNEKKVPPQNREVLVEQTTRDAIRPDYTMTIRGVPKFFVEAKKPAVDIMSAEGPALQARKYGWNANHRLSVLTNFEYLIIYDTRFVPQEEDKAHVARFRTYHYEEYLEKFDEIRALLSKEAVYSEGYDKFLDDIGFCHKDQAQQVDEFFLQQINDWRVDLSNELYKKGGRYTSLEVLNDDVQKFINQIVFLRICEDRNLPTYHNLQDTISDKNHIQNELERLIRDADKRYNSGLFAGSNVIFDLSSDVISKMIEGLYYPQSPYMFNIIEPHLLGKIYELFLTEQLALLPDKTIGLTKKKECINRSVVTTPTEIVKYMVEKTLSRVCKNKNPDEIMLLRIADIACGSGVFLEEVFTYLQNYIVQWYVSAGQIAHLVPIGTDLYKLPLEEKKQLLCSCIYGIDIDIHAVEVAKFSLLIKLIEDETEPSVALTVPILPNLDDNICFGNALINDIDIENKDLSLDEKVQIASFNWEDINNGNGFDVIIGNPPYVTIEGMYKLLPHEEIETYKSKFKTSYKQFDKYFLFIEQALAKIKKDGYVSYIVPNKFFKNEAGKNLRELITRGKHLVHIDDFRDAQLFDGKTTYSTIIEFSKASRERFNYASVSSPTKVWIGQDNVPIELDSDYLDESPWRLTNDIQFLKFYTQLRLNAVPITKYVDVFNGIQTSAERPKPIYWFSKEEIVGENELCVKIIRNGKQYSIEKKLLRPYFKPTKKVEKGKNSYSKLVTDKQIIFPYDELGKLISLDSMKKDYPGTLTYLTDHYEDLVPKCISSNGKRDVPNATKDTWYQYGRTQALTSFIDTPKLIVGILSKDPMYALDKNDMLIASGGTAGYCAISIKKGSPYRLEYIQAWLNHPITEKIVGLIGSDFENGFKSRGTSVLKALPFVELNWDNETHVKIHNDIVQLSQKIYKITDQLETKPDMAMEKVLVKQKNRLLSQIDDLIKLVYEQNKED